MDLQTTWIVDIQVKFQKLVEFSGYIYIYLRLMMEQCDEDSTRIPTRSILLDGDITLEWKIIGFMNFNGRLVDNRFRRSLNFETIYRPIRRWILTFPALDQHRNRHCISRVKSIMIRYARLLTIRTRPHGTTTVRKLNSTLFSFRFLICISRKRCVYTNIFLEA